MRSEAMGSIGEFDASPVARFVGHTVEASGAQLDFSPDGTQLASAGYDGRLQLWDINENRQVREIVDPAAREGDRLKAGTPLPVVRFRPDGSYLAYATWSETVGVVGLGEGQDQLPVFKSQGVPRSLGFDGSGSIVAVSTLHEQNNVIDVFDAQSGALKRRILNQKSKPGEPIPFNLPVALNFKGDRLAAIGPDHAVQIYDVSGEGEPLVLGHHRLAISSLSFNPSGTLIASASRDHSVKLWDVSGKEDPIILAGHSNQVRCVTFSPDGNLVATAGEDQTVRLWDARTGQSLMVFQTGMSFAQCVAFSPDGSKLAAGGYAGNRGLVYLYQLSRRQEKRALAGHERTINDLAFHPTKQLLASGSVDRTVMFWDLQTGLPQQQEWKETRNNPIAAIAFSPPGDLLAVGVGAFTTGSSTNFAIDLRDAESGEIRRRLTGPQSPIVSMAFDKSGQQMTAATRDGAMFVWNTQTGIHTNEWQAPATVGLFTGKGTQLIMLDAAGTIAIRDLAENRTVKEVNLGARLSSIVTDHDTDRVTVIGSEGSLWVLTLPGLETVVHKKRILGGGITTLATSLDGRWWAIYQNDYRVVLWDARTHRQICTLPQITHVRSLAFDQDGLRLAICGAEGLITLWNIALIRPVLAAINLDWEESASQASAQQSLLAEIQPPPPLKHVLRWDVQNPSKPRY